MWKYIAMKYKRVVRFEFEKERRKVISELRYEN